jgi:hypothetical protein
MVRGAEGDRAALRGQKSGRRWVPAGAPIREQVITGAIFDIDASNRPLVNNTLKIAVDLPKRMRQILWFSKLCANLPN